MDHNTVRCARAFEEHVMMIVDSHIHIFPEEILGHLPKGFDMMYKTFKRDISPGLSPLEEFIKDMDEAGVDKAVLLPVDAETTLNYKIPNEYIGKQFKDFRTDSSASPAWTPTRAGRV